MSSPVTPDAPYPTQGNSPLTFPEKLRFLRGIAAHPVRQPSLTLQCAADILASHSSKLSDAERCAVHEQAAVAALECGRVELAGEYHRFLAKRFGRSSVRVRRLQGLLLEGQGNREAAVALYKQLLLESPALPSVAKRFAAILRAGGEYAKAIETLESLKIYVDPKDKQNTYTFMELHSSDENACRELCALNWLTWNIPRAVHYGEELLLVDPHSFMHHCRLGELLFSAGDLPRSATSFAQSLRLNDAINNTRAMYGLWLVSSLLLVRKGSAVPGGPAAPGCPSGSSASARAAAVVTAKSDRRAVAAVTVSESGSVAAKNAAALRELAEARLRAAYHGSPMLPCLDLMLQAYSVCAQ